MKKILATSLLVAGAAGTAQAAGSFADAMKNASVSGQFRFGYVTTSPDVSGTSDTTGAAIGGILKLETAEWNRLQFAVAPYFSENIDALGGDEADGELSGDFLDANLDSFAYLGEAYINYNFGNGSVRVGRQQLDNPFINTDDIRMNPNTFNASWLTMDLGRALKLEAGVVKTWAGIDSGDDKDKFKDTSGDGVTAIGLSYAVNEALGVQAWSYDFDESHSLLYVDGAYTTGKLEIAAQYASFDEDNASGVDGSAMGIAATYATGPWVFTAAMNSASNDADKGVSNGLGGGNFFTSMDEMTIDGLTEAEATVMGVEYAVNENFTAGIAMGHFEDDGAATADIDETDIVLSYAASDNLDVEFVHASVENDADTTDEGTNFSRQLVRVNYNF
jgi:hypothetical protein